MLRPFGVGIGAFVFATAFAAQAADFEGIGNARCGRLINEYDAADRSFRQDLIVATSQWAMGYMTGLNIRLPENRRRELGSFNKLTLGREILRECRSYPRKSVARIVTTMYFSAPPYRTGVS